MTLASVVQSEGYNEEDFKNIASVFYNRLKTGIPLESCVTSYYGVKKDMTDELLQKILMLRILIIQEEIIQLKCLLVLLVCREIKHLMQLLILLKLVIISSYLIKTINYILQKH